MIYPSIEIQEIDIPNELNEIGYMRLKANKKKYLFEINLRSDVKPNIMPMVGTHLLTYIGNLKDNWNVYLESQLIQKLLKKEFGELKKLYFSDIPEALLIIEEQKYSVIFILFNK